MTCPGGCGTEYVCACRACANPAPTVEWVDGETERCLTCGFTADAAAWLDAEVDQMKAAGTWPSEDGVNA